MTRKHSSEFIIDGFFFFIRFDEYAPDDCNRKYVVQLARFYSIFCILEKGAICL